MAVELATLKKELDALKTSLTDSVLDMQRTLLADMDTKYNHILSQLQLLLGKSDVSSSGGGEKKPPKRVVASTESTTSSEAEYPNLVGIAEKYVNTLKGFIKRRVRTTYLKIRAALDEPWYSSTIPEEFRNEHENSTKAEKAKKVGPESLREYVATQWWDANKGDKTYEENVKKEMNEWVDTMLKTTTMSAPVMDNE
jgi:hypothetical protein